MYNMEALGSMWLKEGGWQDGLVGEIASWNRAITRHLSRGILGYWLIERP